MRLRLSNHGNLSCFKPRLRLNCSCSCWRRTGELLEQRERKKERERERVNGDWDIWRENENGTQRNIRMEDR